MMTSSLRDYLLARGDRCPDCLMSIPEQGHEPGCIHFDEYAIFVAALKQAARSDGTVHQGDVRPLIRDRIEPKHIGRCYQRARRERLIVENGLTRSTDVAGKNAGRPEPTYRLGRAA